MLVMPRPHPADQGRTVGEVPPLSTHSSLIDGGLRFHGDLEVRSGLVDLAVNVRSGVMPSWLSGAISGTLTDLARYPDQGVARAAVAARHGRPPSEVLLTAGAAQAFSLLAQALRPTHAVVVHPAVHRARSGPAQRRPRGRPGAPAARVHARSGPGAGRRRPGHHRQPHQPDLGTAPRRPPSPRSPAPAGPWSSTRRSPTPCPGEPESLAAGGDVPGLVVVRSFTKTWGLAGLRIGLPARRQPTWSTGWPRSRRSGRSSTPALAAAAACAAPRAVAAERDIAARLAVERAHLVDRAR